MSLVLRYTVVILATLVAIKLVIQKLDKFFEHNLNLEEYLIQQVNGTVERQNFTYYSIDDKGKLKILLETTLGDADLYVASSRKPDFQPGNHDLASATCGLESIVIEESMKRPIIVGIYGTGSESKSEFLLSMFINLKELEIRDKSFNLNHKLNFIIRYTAMWRVFELLEAVLFVL